MAKKIRFEVPNHKRTTKHNFVATWVFTDGSPHKWNFTKFYWVVFRNICNTNIFINILLSYLITFVATEYFVLKIFNDLSRKLCVLTLIATCVQLSMSNRQRKPFVSMLSRHIQIVHQADIPC